MNRRLTICIAVALLGCGSNSFGQLSDSFLDISVDGYESQFWRPSLRQAANQFFIGDGRSTTSVYGGWTFPANDQNLGYWYPRTSFDIGGVLGLSAGRRYGPRWRTEVDVNFRRNLPDRNTFPYVSYLFEPSSLIYMSPALEGNFDTYSGMFNIYYEFDRDLNRFLVPYAGFGVGIAYFDTDLAWDGVGATVSNESTFAFQTIAGVSAKLFPRLELFTEYRYFSAAEVDFTFPEQVTSYYTFPPFESAYKSTNSNLFMGFRLTY